MGEGEPGRSSLAGQEGGLIATMKQDHYFLITLPFFELNGKYES